jgi:hypothetical protein
MKRRMLILVTALTLVAVLIGASIAMAAKPQQAIEMSNGMPSGEHETLLIHGKKAGYQCTVCIPCSTCDPAVQCNVINIPEYGQATIKYVSGKKVKIDELTVFDSCGGWSGTNPVVDDPAEVWLPYEQQGYWVFARTLGKPGKVQGERYIIFENESLEAYTLLVDEVSNPGEIVLGLGLITQNGAFKADASGELYRFDGDSDRGKGKSQGRDITDMFIWSGFVFNPILDVNLDNVVDELDVIADSCPYDADKNGIIDATELATWAAAHLDPDDVALPLDGNVDALDVIADSCPYDANQNGVIDWNGYDPDDPLNPEPNSEFDQWLFDNQTDVEGNLLWAYYEEVWVFTIADLVYLNQVVTNTGIKNVQIRFYPKDTTVFTPFTLP